MTLLACESTKGAHIRVCAHFYATCVIPRFQEDRNQLSHAPCQGFMEPALGFLGHCARVLPTWLAQEDPTWRAGTLQHLSARPVSLKRSMSTAVL